MGCYSSSGNRPNAAFLLSGVAGILLTAAPTAAHADALTISSATTVPLATVSASNASAGDIIVDSSGSVIVTTTDPAVTINSANSLINSGTIQSSAITGATGVLINGAATSSANLTNNLAIGVTGTGGSGNIGLRVAGGPVTGTIASSTASSISVTGTGAIGASIESAFTGNITLNSVTVAESGSTAVSLTAPLTGSLKLTGTNAATAANSYGLIAAGAISGQLINGGTLLSGASSSTITASDGTTSSGGAVGGGAALWIQTSVGGGVINDRYYLDSNGAVVATASATSSDTLYTGTITGYAGSTAILIKPSAVAANITLSSVGATGSDDGYGLVNRGAISTAGSNTGTAATAISIAGADVGGSTYGVTIENGIINQSTGTIGATATDATATAIGIGAAAVVPTIANAGSIVATTSKVTTGSSAYGIAIAIGAQVSSISNSGTITATSSGTGTSALAVVDYAGTVGSVINSGTISAVGTTGDTIRAIDLSAGTIAQTVTNSGKITGDIVFGSGGGSYISSSGTLSGALSFGAGSNLLQLTGASTFANTIALASGATLAVAVAGTSSLSVSGNAPTLSSLSMSDQSQLSLGITGITPALTVSGAASFTGTSSIKLVVSQNLSSTPITVLTAGGGISTDHLATLLSGTSTPYLYTLDNYSIANNALTVTLHQKSASEIGLAAAVAPIYDQSLAAFGSRASFQAVANLPDQASVLAAYRQILPPSYGSFPIRLAQSLQSAGMGAISARLDTMIDLPSDVAADYRFAPWIQQTVTFMKHDDSQDDPGFRSSGYGIAFGGDYALSKALVVGGSFNFVWRRDAYRWRHRRRCAPLLGQFADGRSLCRLAFGALLRPGDRQLRAQRL